MDAKIAKLLQAAADSIGEECETEEAYSGRGMYGSTTHAITLDNPTVLAKLAALVGHDLAEAYGPNARPAIVDFVKAVDGLRYDSMGLGVVCY